MELDEFLREWILGAHMLINIADIDLNLTLAFIDNLGQLLILLVQTLNVSIDGCEAILEVIDLVVENLVMSVHGDFTID